MNPHNRHLWTLCAILLLALTLVSFPRAEFQRVGPVRVDLIAEKMSITPGEPFDVGLYIIPDENWHVYWRNPGDAGLPPSLSWDVPDGFAVSDIHWPAPSLIKAGPLAAYGYYGDALYPVTITPPNNLIPGDTITLTLKADWLVCKVECLPGSAELKLRLPVTADSAKDNRKWAGIFEQVRQRLPQPLPENWAVQAAFGDDNLYVDIRPAGIPATALSFEFFAADKAVIQYSTAQTVTESGDSYRLELQRSPYSPDKPDSLRGILAVYQSDTTEYYDISIPFDHAMAGASVAAQQPVSGLFLAILFAFAGGLILNLMPCVLPVLSLKVLGLVQQANQGRRSTMLHGFFFMIGVIVSFWVIVGVMLILQAGGAALGWGFQLQSPFFVMILAGFMFLFALSLFGVYDIGFLAGSANVIGRKKHSGLGSAFVSGVTATLVATPCTAPFMGAALGYSLTQPPVVSIMIYTGVGLGMAAPYMLLSAFPQLLRFVPKPGKWMETLKQAMGFVLAATVIWLGWVLASQSGAMAVVILMSVLLLLSVAAWIYGRWGGVASTSGTRRLSRALATVILLITLGFGGVGINAFGYTPNTASDLSDDGIVWQEFSFNRLNTLLANRQTVFIDFTAAWCLSCQVNEKIAFSSDAVRIKFKELNIVALKADWTHRSEEITRALAGYGRNSVPLYVLYDAGSDTPILLPEILTPGIVLNALEKIMSNSEHE